MNLFVLPFFSFTCCCYSFCRIYLRFLYIKWKWKISRQFNCINCVLNLCVYVVFSLGTLNHLSTMGWRMLYWTLNMYTGKNVQEFTDLTNFFFFFFSRRYPLRLVEQIQLWKRQYDEEWPVIILWIKIQ